MSTTLTQVSHQWANRPDDETFDSLESAYKATKAFAEASIEKPEVEATSIKALAQDGDVMLVGKGNKPTRLTNWAFGQLSHEASAPASYLRTLPAELATENINYGLGEHYKIGDESKLNLYLAVNGDKLSIRSINSEKYSRIYNHELLAKLIDLQQYGWKNPQLFKQGDRVPTIWASDHDFFAFQTYDERLIKVPGEDRYLRRGFIMRNSEVGAAPWDTMSFVYDFMCANRMLWGVESISQISIRHIGRASERVDELMDKFRLQLVKYADHSPTFDERKIMAARDKVVQGTKEEVIDLVFSKLRAVATRKSIEAGYDTARTAPDTTASPQSIWGLAQGMTRAAQSIPYTDQRLLVERAAGKLVDMAAAF